jgi:RimJ/RimL family protein N-acetyltransferase
MKSEISNDLITIRRYFIEDTDALYEAVRESIDEVSVWLPWCHPNYSKQESIDWISMQMDAWDYGNEFSFFILEKSTEKLIGGVGLNQIVKEHKMGNLGYWIRTGYTGKGIATAATKMCAKFGFEELKLNRIEIIAATENYASIRVAEKAGATREALLRNRLIVNDKILDAVLFSLIPGDILK